jgi:hypothetical protein
MEYEGGGHRVERHLGAMSLEERMKYYREKYGSDASSGAGRDSAANRTAAGDSRRGQASRDRSRGTGLNEREAGGNRKRRHGKGAGQDDPSHAGTGQAGKSASAKNMPAKASANSKGSAPQKQGFLAKIAKFFKGPKK